eukprot:UN27545
MASTGPIIFGCGNPLLDISNDVDDAFLKKYDIKMGNAILATDKHLPMYKELCDKKGVKFVAGGSTLNSIRIAQWFLQKEGATGYIGCVGKDDYAATMEKNCKTDGVATNFMKCDKATGTCAVAVKAKERSLVANLSAANEFKADHMNTKESKAIWENAKVCYIAGFWLTVTPETMISIGKHCQTNKRPFIINVSAPFLVQFFKEKFESVLPYVTHIFGNESESAAVAEHVFGDKKLTHEQTAAKLASYKGKRNVIFTQGADSTYVHPIDGKTFSVPVAKVKADDIVDLNGAGDAMV